MRILDLPDTPDKSRLQRRIEKLRDVRRTPVSGKEQIAAGAVAELSAGLLVFALMSWLGLIEAGLYLAGLAAVFGLMIGVVLGVKTPSGGIMAGILAGVWFLIHGIGALAMVLAEGLAAIMLLSLFSCG